ncbi:unnamed protein product [Durusdinium trenchii]|uniref:Uncharacterized protein n=1 Tax=Durusdinium trenchii TaxID=1381693 RepID=A0ABP0HWP6_9DINO
MRIRRTGSLARRSKSLQGLKELALDRPGGLRLHERGAVPGGSSAALARLSFSTCQDLSLGSTSRWLHGRRRREFLLQELVEAEGCPPEVLFFGAMSKSRSKMWSERIKDAYFRKVLRAIPASKSVFCIREYT